jgi:hypothetical protein
MGCDCDGKLLGWVKPKEIVKALSRLGYENIKDRTEGPKKDWLISDFKEDYPNCRIEINPSYPKSEYHETLSGFINFSAYGEDRMIFYYYSNVCEVESLKYLPENEGIEVNEIQPKEFTSLSLGMWGHSSEIMKDVVKSLGGGYVDENDCDDIPPYFVVPLTDVRKEV